MTQPQPLQSLFNASFRANPSYTFVIYDRLSEVEKKSLERLREDPDFFGILKPISSKLSYKSVCRETALLFYILQTPGKLPEYIFSSHGDDTNKLIAQLVLDSILEIETAEGFISGVEAYKLLGSDILSSRASRISYKIEKISHDALLYGQAFVTDNLSQLSHRLYLYNRRPVTREWKQRLKSREAVEQFLGLVPEKPNYDFIHRYWYCPNRDADAHWVFWRSKSIDVGEATTKPVGYKLYFNPTCEYLSDTLCEVTEVLFHCRAQSFKYGSDVYGMLRPDKFVAYFQEKDDLFTALDRLQRQLSGVPAQGVPFTATVDNEGLLSWGMDPPSEESLLPWQGTSWRSWLTDRLAVALIAGHHQSNPSTEPWQFALARVELEGIDTSTWTPSQSLWN